MTLEEAHKILGKTVQSNGELQALGHYTDYIPRREKARQLEFLYGPNTVTLDDDFTADELEAMAVHMRANP